MKRVRLGSAAIAAVQYDEEKRTLEVEFRDGYIYRYFHVPEFVYRELLKARSAGTFWNRVKDNYEFTRADKPNRKRRK
jgi:lysyl-tRNA synthetase class 2